MLAAGFVIIYAVGSALAWFVFRSPFFKVEHVTVTGNKAVPSESVVALLQSQALANGSFLRAALGFDNMLAWPDSLPPATLAFAPALASVAVNKDYFSNTITANVTERTPIGVWCFMPRSADESVVGSRKCYWFDAEGILFERAIDTEGALFFTVEDRAQRSKGLGLKILPDRFVANAISIVNVLHASGLPITNIRLDDLSREEVFVVLAKGPALYFSLRFPADNYLPVIKSLMTDPGFSKIQYIDCRTENRVYYK